MEISQKAEKIMQALDIRMEDLTEEQFQKIVRFSPQVEDPENMIPKQAVELVEELGIDIDAIQKKNSRLRAQERLETKKVKIRVNDPCPCGSGKKFKKCCIWKDISHSG